ncbi:putative Major facilitator superfamily domain-containing protein [Seiridium cardinale]
MSRDTEKADVEYVPEVELTKTTTGATNSWETEYSPEEQRRIIRRIDRRLVTTVGVMYCVSLMDRTNLSAANIAGMAKELQLVGNRYSIITLVFFVTYIVFQPPSTVVVRKIGPRIHLSIITLLWGAVMIAFGFVKNYQTLTALRCILGILEAGFFPSCVYLLSTWYTRYEVGKRYSFFYVIGCVASAFAGILAYGLMQMNGLASLTGWRWIFIMEGLITCIISVASYWLLVDFPDSQRKLWKFLSDKERAWVVKRINADRGDATTPKFQLGRFLKAGLDWKIWCYAMIFFNTTTVTYALAYFLPIILNTNLGFSIGASQCLIAPPYAFAGFVMFGTGWLGDRYHIRGPIIIINMVLCLIGTPIMGWHPNPSVRYFGIFLVTAGANSNVPAALSYQANNIRGQWKRAFCSATFVGFGGIGGIAGSLVFRAQDEATGYKPGLYAAIACAALNIILVLLVDTKFYFDNRAADRGVKELEHDEDSRLEFNAISNRSLLTLFYRGHCIQVYFRVPTTHTMSPIDLPAPASLPTDFVVSPMTVEDIKDVVTTHHAAFSSPAERWWWSHDLNDMRKFQRVALEKNLPKPDRRYLKITHLPSGRVAAWLSWALPQGFTGLNEVPSTAVGAEGTVGVGKEVPDADKEVFKDEDLTPEERAKKSIEQLPLPEGSSKEALIEALKMEEESHGRHGVKAMIYFERQGLARALVEPMLTVSEAEGVPVWVDSSPKGKGFYEKLGFKVVQISHVDLAKGNKGLTGTHTVTGMRWAQQERR